MSSRSLGPVTGSIAPGLAGTWQVSAQEVGRRPGGTSATAVAPVLSPAVANGMVTFRLRAPEARSVTVPGDFGVDATMSRGSDGVWSATLGPLAPEVYVYYFNVDGVRLLDLQAKIG